MRHYIARFLFMTLAFLGSAVVLGQSSASNVLENPELANARAMLQAGRADIIREDLRMTDSESAEFWPVYDKYHEDIMVVRDRQATMIADFLKTYRHGALTNEYAEDLLKEHLEIESELLKIRKEFVRRFNKVLPAVKVARFYQLENKMDADIDVQLALFIPLAEAM